MAPRIAPLAREHDESRPQNGAGDELAHLDTHILSSRASTGRSAPGSVAAVEGGDRYDTGELIGRGGMGEVWRALDRKVGRDVAIKVMWERHIDSPDSVARFLREARVQGLLDHPAIVPVHDLGIDAGGRPYFVMKRVSGVTLGDVSRARAQGDADAQARFSRRTLLARFADVCQAIEFAHSRGVVHRDIKPTNIMLGDYGEVWVLDWGCAKVAGTTYIPGPIDVDMPAPGETHDGAVIGTPGFMAPEQLVAGAACDHRVDVYALGCVLFEILAGQSLHPAGPGAVRSTVIGGDARPSSRVPDADIPPELDDVCVRATARDPDARYPRVRDLHDAVLHYLDGDRDLGRRRELAAVHLASARAARGCDQPAVAMREAGRALALDPSSGDAATLVAQLMLEPPAIRPAEVEVAIAASDAEISRVHGRATVFAYIAYACMLALFYVQGITDGRMFAVISVLVGVLASGACIASRMREVPSLPLVTLMLLGNALLIALLSRFAGPFAVLPATLCSTIIALVSHPALLAHPVRVVVIMMAGFLAPFGLEAAGIWEPTWSVTGGALLSRSAFVDFTGPGVAPLLVLLVVADTAWTGWTTWKLVRVHRDAQSRLELHAWHLRQLVGDDRDRASP